MKKGKTKLTIPALTFSLLLLFSCNSSIIFTDSAQVPDKVWQLDFNPVFSADITDTLTNCNILFTIRNGSDYSFRNLFLFVATTSPDGASITDTLEYTLADEKGNWFGKGFGDVHELTVQYKSNIYFPSKGKYIFKIQHGMRSEELKGVYDFGIRIVKTNNN